MTRYLKTLGLALVAVLALSAVAASAASAGKLTLSEYPGFLNGTQSGEANILELEGGRTTECEKVNYSGEYKESEVAEEMASATPEYVNCTSEILGNVTPTTVTVNGCTITFSIGAVSDATHATGQAHLRCPAGKKLEIHVWKTTEEHHADVKPSFCTYTVPEQTVGAAGSISYSINESHNLLTVSGSKLALNVERTGGTLTNCGKAAQVGNISAAAEVKAENELGSTLTGTFS